MKDHHRDWVAMVGDGWIGGPMFKKRNGNGTTVVAGGASFEGSLELEGDAHIEGKFEGSLTSAGDISVGPHGCVLGTLTANVVTVAGRAEGTIVAKMALRVLASGGAKGRLYYQSLQVESGGVIAGEVHNGAPPARDVTRDSAAPAATSGSAAPDESVDSEERSHISSVAPPPASMPPPPANRPSAPLQVAAKR
jgi:cytoskeletal protein CcmA (bactofilin family)